MEAVTILQGDGADEAHSDDRWRSRRAGRCQMFKPAQIAFGGSVLDCVLLDASPSGAQVCLRTSAEVPDLVTLRLPGCESRSVRRCWQEGARIGFEVVGTAPLVFRAG